MRHTRIALAAATLLLACAPTARADISVFLGATATPANRLVRGVSIGAGFGVLGVEGEVASTVEDASAGAPGLTEASANLVVHPPDILGGFQPYVTAGGGIVRETLGAAHAVTAFAPNVGGGVKLPLVGPVGLKVDYRIFWMGGGALYSPAHRLTAGVNVRF